MSIETNIRTRGGGYIEFSMKIIIETKGGTKGEEGSRKAIEKLVEEEYAEKIENCGETESRTTQQGSKRESSQEIERRSRVLLILVVRG